MTNAGKRGLPGPGEAWAWLEPLDHTADEGIRVRARTLPLLFERAALGMFSLLTDLSAVKPAAERVVEVRAGDREALLVRWLSELNFLHQTEHLLFCRFQVSGELVSEGSAVVWGEPVDSARHWLKVEIKAVTFHHLSVRREQGVWIADVLFDV
jgi:SHS2 domain-containing protein